MHDLYPQRYKESDLDAIDAILFSDSPTAAGPLLLDNMKYYQAIDPDHYHRLAIKAAALPFYELARLGPNEERYQAAKSVYATTTALIDQEISEGLSQASISTLSERQHRRGRISEKVILNISNRDFSPTSNHIPLPARRVDDHAGSFATDILLFPVHNRVSQEWLQVKTFLTKEELEDHSKYDSYVSLVGLNQLDNFYDRQEDERSLFQCMKREIEGTASSEDINKLDEATRTFYDIIDKQVNDRMRTSRYQLKMTS